MRKRLTEEQRSQIGRRYIAGENSLTLSEEYGVSHVAVLKLLERKGIRRRPAILNRDERRRMAAEFMNGLSVRSLALKYGRRESTIAGWLLPHVPAATALELEEEFRPVNHGRRRHGRS